MSQVEKLEQLNEFRSSLKGGMVTPHDKALYDSSCNTGLFNKLESKHPNSIVHCTHVDDICKAVQFARHNGLKISVKAGGWHPSGLCMANDGLVVDLSSMKSIKIDPQKKLAFVEAGVTASELYAATLEHNLAFPGPYVSSIGIAGFTLGGGVGAGYRLWGAACDNLVGAELVLEDGKNYSIDKQQNNELMWALKGAGGLCGVASRLVLQLHDIESSMLTLEATVPLHGARSLMTSLRGWNNYLPKEVEMSCILLTEPSDRSKVCAMLAAYFGKAEKGKAELEPIRSYVENSKHKALREEQQPAAKVLSWMNSLYPSDRCYYMSGVFVDDLVDAVTESLIQHFEFVTSPHSTILITSSASTHDLLRENAFGPRGKYYIQLCACWDTDANSREQQHAHIEWVKRAEEIIKPYVVGHYVNTSMLRSEKDLRECYEPRRWAMLKDLKAKYDTHNVFMCMK